MAHAEPSQSTGRDTGMNLAEGFGRFKNDLADHLDLQVIKKISNFLGLKPGKIASIKRSETHGEDMVDLLESRGLIAPTGISGLVKMLHKLHLAGLAQSIQQSFQASKGHSLPLEGGSSAGSSINVKETLNSINPLDLQYVYRFACGLNKSAADIIIKHLSETKEGHQFAILCMLEQEEKSDQCLQSVKDLVSRGLSILSSHAKVSQRATIQVLEFASANQIPISRVDLVGCSPRVDESGPNLILQSGLSLSILSSLQKLWIFDNNRRLTNEEWAAILSYSSHCTSLEELLFHLYDLPDTIPVGSIPLSLRARNVKVWNFSEYIRLNLQTGQWQVCDNAGNLPGEEGFDERSYQRSLPSRMQNLA